MGAGEVVVGGRLQWLQGRRRMVWGLTPSHSVLGTDPGQLCDNTPSGRPGLPLLLIRDWHKIQFKRKHWNFSHSLPRLGMSCTNPYFVSKEPVRWFKFLTEIQEISCIFDGDYIKGDLSHKMKVNMKTRSREGSVTGSIVISQLVKVINFVFLSLWNI